MSTKKWATLLKAIQTGSISRASTQLGYTQSGITHIIKSLEAEVGFMLLERSWDGVRPTSACEELLPDIQRLVDSDIVLQKHLGTIQDAKREHVSIGTYASISTHWLPGLLMRLRHDIPNVEIVIRVGFFRDMAEWLDQGTADMILGERYEERQDFSWIPLYDDPFYAIVPETHPASGEPFFRPEAFYNLPLFYDSGSPISKRIVKSYESFNRQVNISSEDEAVIISMVRQEMGCAVLPELCLRGRTDHISALPLKTPLYRSLGMTRKKDHPIGGAQQRLIELLKEFIREQKPSI